MSSELRKYGSTSVVQTSNIGFTSEVSDYLVVHTGPGGELHVASYQSKEAEQTVHHIPQDCPIRRKQRHQLWPQAVGNQQANTNKLWGTVEDLRRTTNSWQHVDWGSKHSWTTAEEEEEEASYQRLESTEQTSLHRSICELLYFKY